MTQTSELPGRLRERAIEAGYPKSVLYLEAADEIDRLCGLLRHIATMDVFTRPGEEEPHILMMKIAARAGLS